MWGGECGEGSVGRGVWRGECGEVSVGRGVYGREARCMADEEIYKYTFWCMAVAIDLLHHVFACLLQHLSHFGG